MQILIYRLGMRLENLQFLEGADDTSLWTILGVIRMIFITRYPKTKHRNGYSLTNDLDQTGEIMDPRGIKVFNQKCRKFLVIVQSVSKAEKNQEWR